MAARKQGKGIVPRKRGKAVVEPEYRPEYADEARELCSEGANVMEVAEHFHVAMLTVMEWAQAHPDFGEALTAKPWTLEHVAATSAVSPEHHAAAVVRTFAQRADGTLQNASDDTLLAALHDSVQDAEYSERTLLAQAHALDAMFADLAKRAARQQDRRWLETIMRLALRAQGQCRATLETLSTIRNPPVVFAKQANIAAGHQQINNGPLPAREPEKFAPVELLEAPRANPEWMDAGAARAAASGDKAMATVATLHRAQNG